MVITVSGRLDGFRHGFQAFGRPQGECEARQDHVARRPNPEEGRRHAQLRRQQFVRHPLHHLRRGVPQGRTVSRRQKETQRFTPAEIGQLSVQRPQRPSETIVYSSLQGVVDLGPCVFEHLSRFFVIHSLDKNRSLALVSGLLLPAPFECILC